jgi:hypothetical protein
MLFRAFGSRGWWPFGIMAFGAVADRAVAVRVGAPPEPLERCLAERGSVAVFARSRPQQGVAVATLVVEQVRVDRRVEGGVVELEREIVAPFLRMLRPGCTNLSLMRCTA